MKKLILIAGIMSFLLVMHVNLFAQTTTSNQELTMGIPEVLLINAVVASGSLGALTLELTTTVAGTAIAGGTGTSYAQVSSIVATAETRSITAAVTGVPTGTALSVTTAIPATGNQAGVLGAGTSGVALVNAAAATDIVTGIGSCYTGTTPGDGYSLAWTWDAGALGDYGSIVATAGATATVVLTITNTP